MTWTCAQCLRRLPVELRRRRRDRCPDCESARVMLATYWRRVGLPIRAYKPYAVYVRQVPEEIG